MTRAYATLFAIAFSAARSTIATKLSGIALRIEGGKK